MHQLLDDGFVELANANGTGAGPGDFLSRCRQLRYYQRRGAAG